MNVLDLIEFNSFANIWYWILVALTWARVTQVPMGVPYDLVLHADGSQTAAKDLIAITALQVRRRRVPDRRRGPWIVGVWAFLLTLLAGLGFYYGSVFAFSVLLIVAPLALISAMSQKAARDIDEIGPELEAIIRRLRRLKRWNQAIAMIAVFVTAVIGMVHNLANSSF